MQYLLREVVRSKKKSKSAPVAHLWDGDDTACRMWSTNGIVKKKRYRVTSDPEGRPICQMCQAPRLDDQFRRAVEAD